MIPGDSMELEVILKIGMACIVCFIFGAALSQYFMKCAPDSLHSLQFALDNMNVTYHNSSNITEVVMPGRIGVGYKNGTNVPMAVDDG